MARDVRQDSWGSSVPSVANFCGLPISLGLTIETALDAAFATIAHNRPTLTTFINPHSFHLARRDPEYLDALTKFNIVLPDGIGVVWGLRLLTSISTSRVSFDSTSLALPLLHRASRERLNVMLIGGRRGVSDNACRQLTAAVPELRISAVMDGFCEFPRYEAAVRLANPDIIICGMGAPRQEKLLMHLAQAKAFQGLGYTCGGYFDQLQKSIDYYPNLFTALNLRWFYRLIREPRRLARRYFIEYQSYFLALTRQLALRRRGVA